MLRPLVMGIEGSEFHFEEVR